MLMQETYTYATHGIPLDLDVYIADDDFPDPSESPIFLYFHPGGLAGGSRACIPPWLVQVCCQRKWPLISPSYRLLPQAGAKDLLEDAAAAYNFAHTWGASVSGSKRPVIVGGSSAGFFMATLIAYHVKPPPVALLCITGIPSFRHPFFSSSKLITPVAIKEEDIARYLDDPVEVGAIDAYDESTFHIYQILPTGQKNVEYTHPTRPATVTSNASVVSRDSLYDYWLYQNAYLDLVGDVDPGFRWAKEDKDGDKLQDWPFSIFIQGDADTDVSMDVTTHAVECLGPDKAKLCLAQGAPHLFEAKSFLEDEPQGMAAVREAIDLLDTHLQSRL
ncbi:Alpha/Beta hydrolase protein [Hypoxylon sp. FL0890]|nr:Alpha/Beta hydrolase protein [Hypoxylon sp. FL0890]